MIQAFTAPSTRELRQFLRWVYWTLALATPTISHRSSDSSQTESLRPSPRTLVRHTCVFRLLCVTRRSFNLVLQNVLVCSIRNTFPANELRSSMPFLLCNEILYSPREPYKFATQHYTTLRRLNCVAEIRCAKLLAPRTRRHRWGGTKRIYSYTHSHLIRKTRFVVMQNQNFGLIWQCVALC